MKPLPASTTPLPTVRPLELFFHRRRHAPAVGEAELSEHCLGGGQSEVVHQILPEDAHGHRIEKERALSGETDHASLWVQLQKLVVM
jgi:hypothetical protein